MDIEGGLHSPAACAFTAPNDCRDAEETNAYSKCNHGTLFYRYHHVVPHAIRHADRCDANQPDIHVHHDEYRSSQQENVIGNGQLVNATFLALSHGHETSADASVASLEVVRITVKSTDFIVVILGCRKRQPSLRSIDVDITVTFAGGVQPADKNTQCHAAEIDAGDVIVCRAADRNPDCELRNGRDCCSIRRQPWGGYHRGPRQLTVCPHSLP